MFWVVCLVDSAELLFSGEVRGVVGVCFWDLDFVVFLVVGEVWGGIVGSLFFLFLDRVEVVDEFIVFLGVEIFVEVVVFDFIF